MHTATPHDQARVIARSGHRVIACGGPGFERSLQPWSDCATLAGRSPRAALVSSVVPCLLKSPTNPDGTEQAVFDVTTAVLRADRLSVVRL